MVTRFLCAMLGAFLAGFLAAAWVCTTSQRTEQPSPADSPSVPGQYPTWPFQPLTTGGTTAPPADHFTVWNSPDANRQVDLDGKPFCPTGYAQRYHGIACDCSPDAAHEAGAI